MGFWIGYARSGREFDVEEAVKALGIEVHVPKLRVAVRSGNNRDAVAEDRLVLPNYTFINCTDEQWYQLDGVKYLAKRKMMVPPAEEPRVRHFLGIWALEYAEQSARIEADITAGKRLSEYKKGDILEILGGVLEGQLATFREVVEDDEGIPRLRVVTDLELLGRPVTADLDVFDVRKAQVAS